MNPEVQFEQFKLVVTVTLMLHTDLESHMISSFDVRQ